MKLAVIGGAGLLGSTAAFYAGGLDLLEEIRLLDIRENMTMSHVMDMDQALSVCSRTKVTKGDYGQLGDCELILITASVPETGTGTRDSYLQANREIVTEICSRLRGLNQNHVIINAVNPVDVINVVIQDCTGLDRRQIIGFSANDTLRLKWAIAKVLDIGADRVDVICLGEHGEKTAPLFSRVFIDQKHVLLDARQKEDVLLETRSWFSRYQALQSGRTSGWTSGVQLARIIAAIASGSGQILPCSAILDGEYGYRAVSVGVPARLGERGITEILELELSSEEQGQLDEAVKKIHSLLQSIRK
ncbi:malate dehydrogenase [Anaerotruncus colihominis]|uniref:malate dehydrogenase n=1 Tax=Anaerotruncus colihominis TaxID=169435 RepID=UPI0026E998AA|nr:hypothetical protein [Anaerotruncus colihominis]